MPRKVVFPCRVRIVDIRVDNFVLQVIERMLNDVSGFVGKYGDCEYDPVNHLHVITFDDGTQVLGEDVFWVPV